MATDDERYGDLPPDTLRAQGHDAIEWVAHLLESCRELPVLARSRPGDLLEQLPRDAPEDACAWEETLEQLDRLILPGITHWNHPRFFAYFANTGSVPGIVASTIATGLNPNGMLWRTSPAATELEQRVLEWLARWLGLQPPPFGIINDTASVSSLVAIAAARQAVDSYDPQRGVAALPGPLRLYESEQAHSSIDKAVLLTGLGLDCIRKIPTRADYSMDPTALAAAVRQDRAAGLIPFCVVATAGTTSSTAIDPVAPIAELCAAEGLWLHVDAAYGGVAAILPEMRPLLAGWEHADSIVLNPHKWLFTPMCCSVLYTRRPETLRAAFSLVPEYLRSDVGDHRATRQEPVDFMNYGIQLGRPFRALKLWMVIRAYGRRGVQDRLRHHIDLAASFAARVDAHLDFERLAPTPLSTVCFRYRQGAGSDSDDGCARQPIERDPWAPRNEAILAAVNEDGRIFLSHTRLRGRLTLRLAIGNLRTTARDVDLAWQLLCEAAEKTSG